MQGLLHDKIVVITGAGSGLGEAAALLFARHGAKLVIGDIDGAAVERTAAAVKAESGAVQPMVCDVADEPAVEKLVRKAVDSYGRLDVIFNNAGITLTRPGARVKLVDATPEDLTRVSGVNINGVVYGCKAAVKQFETQGGGGVIVNTASVSGLIGFGGAVYGATKGAIVALTRTLALEVAAQGIRVNSVCPGGMLTRFAGMNPDSPAAEQIRKGLGARHPLGKVIDPMDCANAALFLASDMASNITGVNLPVDGGLSSGVPT